MLVYSVILLGVVVLVLLGTVLFVKFFRSLPREPWDERLESLESEAARIQNQSRIFYDLIQKLSEPRHAHVMPTAKRSKQFRNLNRGCFPRSYRRVFRK